MPRPSNPNPEIKRQQTAREKKLNLPGRARVWFQGSWHMLGVWGTPEVQEKYKALLEGPTIPTKPTHAEPTIGEVCERFLTASEEEQGHPRAKENWLHPIRPLVRIFGGKPAREFTTEHLEKLQKAFATGSWMTAEEREFRAKQKKPVGWCRSRVNRMCVAVRTIFRWAESKRLVPAGTWNTLRTVPGLRRGHKLARETKPRKPTEYADLLKVASFCPDPVAAMLEAQFWCGCRSSEVRLMRTSEIDTRESIWLYRPSHHKTEYRGHERVIPLGPECQNILKHWLKPNSPDEFIFQPIQRRKKDHYTRYTFCQAVKRACKKAGVKLVPYESRHSCKMRVARACGLEAAKSVLGHRKSSMTEHYGGLDLELAKEAARKTG